MRRMIVATVLICATLLLSLSASATQFDSGFGNGGTTLIPVVGTNTSDLRIARQSTGKLIVGYNTTMGDTATHEIIRLNPDGTLDTSAAIIIPDTIISSYGIRISDIGVDASDRILLWGTATNLSTFNTGLLLIRLLADGGLDTSFDADGYAITNEAGTLKETYNFLIDGTTVYAGAAVNFAGTVFKFTGTGALDTSFDGDGFMTITLTESVSGLAKDAAGRIIAAGYDNDTETAHLWRFNATGTLDNTFSADGMFSFLYDNFNSNFGRLSIASDTSNNLYLSGEAAPDISVVKVSSSGALDSGFSGDGYASGDFRSGNDFAGDLVVDVTGKPIVLATSNSNGISDREITLFRYTTAGALDSGFSGTGKFGVDVFGFDEDGQDMLLSGSSLFVAGFVATSSFETAGSEELLGVIKLDTSTGTSSGKDFVVMNQNTGFETSATTPGLSANWIGANLSGDSRKCNKPNKGKFYAYTLNCAFVFVGGAGEASSIKQVYNNFGATILDSGSVLDYSMMIQAPTVLNLKLKVKIAFTAGGKATLINTAFTAPDADYTHYVGGGFVVPQDVKKITIILLNTAASGKVNVDNLILQEVDLFFAPGRGTRDVLPAPVAPAGFRLAGG